MFFMYLKLEKKNLVSKFILSKKKKKVFKIVFESGQIVLSENSPFVGKGSIDESPFKLNIFVINNNVSTSYVYLLNSYNLWHVRPWHVNISFIK